MMTYYTTAFAIFYERYYTGWVRKFAPRLAEYLAQNQVADRTILDLCCGTGESISVFSQAGWQVVGLDQSRGMLDLAKKKLAPMIGAGRVSLIEGDARNFVLPSPVGACVCLDGALNHLESPSELERCFAAVGASLVEGGQFIFDLLEPSHFRHWHHLTLIDQPDAVIAKRGVWDDDAREGLLRISGAFGDGPMCLRVEQTLRSRAFTPSEVASALRCAGLVRAECDIDSGACCPMGADQSLPDPGGPGRIIFRALRRSTDEGNLLPRSVLAPEPTADLRQFRKVAPHQH